MSRSSDQGTDKLLPAGFWKFLNHTGQNPFSLNDGGCLEKKLTEEKKWAEAVEKSVEQELWENLLCTLDFIVKIK